MPLIVLCGQPCSGKSSIAAALQQMLQPAHPVTVVDEPSLHLERNAAYQTSVQEKATRGALKSAVERSISKRTMVILDSINNIKGYRYELWCVARAAGTRYCMVHVATPTDTCRQWNAARAEGQRYSEAVFEDLAGRFETPDPRQRWDAPLFTVTPGGADQQVVLEAIVAAMAGTAQRQQKQQQKQQQQAAAGDGLSAAALEAGDAGDAGDAEPEGLVGVDEDQRLLLINTAARANQLRPNMATINPTLVATNLLHDIDQAVQTVITRVTEVQQQLSPDLVGQSGTVVDLGAAGRLQLNRHMSLAELRRHKRAFLKLATNMAFTRVQDPAVAQRLFVDHLRVQLG